MSAARPSAETVSLPDAPSIDGLRFRRYLGPADHPGMVDVTNAMAEADGDPERDTVAIRDAYYANLTNCDPSRDILVAEIHGRLVGFARVEWLGQTDGSRRYDIACELDPALRTSGIARSLLHWSLARIAQVGAAHAFKGERWIGIWCNDTDLVTRGLLVEEGFRPFRHYHLMVRPTLDDIALPPLPDGLEVRAVRDEDLRAVYLADDEAFQDHFGGGDTTDAGFRRWVEDPRFDPTLFVIAWDGSQIAGGVLGVIDAAENEAYDYRRGWLDSVFTRRPWRRRGLAAALIGRSLVVLRDRGMTSAQLGVDSDNPHQAGTLYRSAGFVPTLSSTVFRREWG